MNDDQLLRYSRHILLEEIGVEGQQRILDGHALIIGAGGLGSPVALYLGSAGVGTLTVVDHDTVDVTNLQRQIAHSLDRVGQPKVDSIRAAVAAALNRTTPSIQAAPSVREATVDEAGTLAFDWSQSSATGFSYLMEGWSRVPASEDINYLSGFQGTEPRSAWLDTTEQSGVLGDLIDNLEISLGDRYTLHITTTEGGRSYRASHTVLVTGPGGNISPVASFTHTLNGLACDFDASTSSDPDGSILSYEWEFGDGNTDVTSDPELSHTFEATGTYDVTLTVTDNGGATSSITISVSVSDQSGAITLTVTGYKNKGLQKADLMWSGAIGGSVEVHRDGELIASTGNNGFYTDNIDLRGGGSYVYEVCELGGTCSNEATAQF